MQDRNGSLSICLKYHHFWKFNVKEMKKFEQLKIFLQLYLKADTIRSSFAFNYALKYPMNSKVKHPNVKEEFMKLGIDRNPSISKIFNKGF